MAARRHASGFTIDREGHPQQVPMRVSRILDQITIQLDVINFVPILFQVAQIVRREYRTASRWVAADIMVETLRFIDELESLSSIFQASADHVLSQLSRRERMCSTCFPM